MSYIKNNKNIPTHKISPTERLYDLRSQLINIQDIIDRPQKFEDAIIAERELGERISLIDVDELQSKCCVKCFEYMVWTTNRYGERVMIAGPMESFGAFFGMCDCMQKRYVARTYTTSCIDINENNKRDCLLSLAVTASAKKICIEKDIEKILDCMTNGKSRRKNIEKEKDSCTFKYNSMSDNDIMMRLEERKKQAVKNRLKMDNAKARRSTSRYKKN